MFAFTPFDLFFFVVAIATIVSAFWVLLSKNIIHAAIGLLFTLFGVGGLYLMLASDFLGFLQLFVYIGATMVLIMFGIMLTRREEKGSEPGVPLSQKQATNASTILGLFIAGSVFAFLFVILIVSGGDQWNVQEAMTIEPPTNGLGEKLLTEYIYPFEVISVFLMVALIGAAYIARRRDVSSEEPVKPELELKVNVNVIDDEESITPVTEQEESVSEEKEVETEETLQDEESNKDDIEESNEETDEDTETESSEDEENADEEEK